MKITTCKRSLALLFAVIMMMTLWTALPTQASAADSYTLKYSEGALILGSAEITDNAYEETADTSLIINLTSPVGAATTRYFATSEDVAEANWALTTPANTGGTTAAVLTPVTEDRSYGVTIPVGFVGVATLTVGGYKVTFNVTADVPAAITLRKGETFAADGYEWRVLTQKDSELLIISEHVIASSIFHDGPSSNVGLIKYPEWGNSYIRNTTLANLLNNMTFLKKLAVEKTLMTKGDQYWSGLKGFISTNDSIFLLNIEETFYEGKDKAPVENGVTTSVAENRTNGNDVIFADTNARKTTNAANVPADIKYWWLRSPNCYAGFENAAAVVSDPDGSFASGDIITPHINATPYGVRPALWIEPYTLTYSEGALILGSGEITDNAYEETADTSLTVKLTSPVGAETTRYFTINKTVAEGDWALTDTDASKDAVLTRVTEGKSYGVTIPVGFVGDAVLDVGGYTVTFNVTANRPKSLGLNKGETFEADGVEWRVLTKKNVDSLIISEHVIAERLFHHETPYHTWADSDIRAYLNDTYLPALSTLKDCAVKTDIQTKDDRYTGGSLGFSKTEDKIFLPGLEEAFYAGKDDSTTGTTAQRTSGNDVIFADAHARKVSNAVNNSVTSDWWLRSPSHDAEQNAASLVDNSSGAAGHGDVDVALGIRPMLWIDMAWPPPVVYSITVQSDGNGTAAANGIGATEGAEITLTATPNNGYVFKEWHVVSGNITITENTFIMPAQDVTVKAIFAPLSSPVAPSKTNDITSFTLAGSAGIINGTDITVTVPAGTDVTNLAPVITHNGVSVDPASGAPRDFTNPVTYTVTAENGDTKTYTVTVTAATGPLLNGWHYLKPERVWKYYLNSVAKTGWLYYERNWYLLDYTDGHMLVDWQYDRNYKSWFYLTGNGAMKTGWFYDTAYKAWFYFIGDGTMKTGWQYDKQYKAWFYFAGDGAMNVNKWVRYKGSWYYVGGNGKMLTGKRNVGGKVWTFKANGVWVG